ncbi:uncharacterized protein UHOD_12257 [Ustilago sp. UG-2017b]|nr:uncharacterized protein UHOD_12257 [Ustilago sp. UG-2017b]
MIWGCMTWAGLGLMVYIDGRLNSEHYIELLEEVVPGSILKWKNIQRIPSRDKLIFQQDNAHPHTAKVIKEYLEEVKLNVLGNFSKGISPGTHKVDAQEVTGSLNLSFPKICHKLHFIEDTSS